MVSAPPSSLHHLIGYSYLYRDYTRWKIVPLKNKGTNRLKWLGQGALGNMGWGRPQVLVFATKAYSLRNCQFVWFLSKTELISTSHGGTEICGWAINQNIPLCSVPPWKHHPVKSPFSPKQQWAARIGLSQGWYMNMQLLQSQYLLRETQNWRGKCPLALSRLTYHLRWHRSLPGS